MADAPEAITFEASVYKVGTLADNGIRVTLDLPERSFETLAKLASCQQAGVYLAITATPFVPETLTGNDETEATEAETKTGASQVDRRRSTKRRDKRAGG